VFSNVLLVQSAALVGVGLVLAFVGAVGSGRSAARRARLAAAHDEADW
jgi:type II secretory pathway predicted ATPase ExeA